MKNDKIRVKRIIQRCGCDMILPLTLVYIFYIILHGHLSPGGGFQGGVLVTAVVLLIYLGHGYEITARVINGRLMRKTEAMAVVVYIALAMTGVVMGAYFCQNVLFENGSIGDLLSSGTIAFMNAAVGVKVFAGVAALVLSVIALLMAQDIDFQE